MTIPLVDLKAQYQTIKDSIDNAIERVVKNTSFVLGEEVAEFEHEFAEYVGSNYCVGVNSGTAALYLALKAADIGIGDEVILPANTFIATAEAVSLTGATPVFVDIDELSFTIDPTLVEQAITFKTKAIIPVHLYGQCADMYAINDIAVEHRLMVIEDACQAHGAEYGGEGDKAGNLDTVAGCFSFYPGKNLGSYGEGGAVVTNNKRIANLIRAFRNHGGTKKYEHNFIGGNYRLEALQAAILRAKLPFLDQWNNRRNQLASHYEALLEGAPIATPKIYDYGSHVWHLYVVRVKERDRVLNELNEKGIGAGIHYPLPIHLTLAYAFLNKGIGSFPITEEVAKQIISLPMYPELTTDKISFICETLLESVCSKSV